jgi:Gamma-glutamyltranspeptidase
VINVHFNLLAWTLPNVNVLLDRLDFYEPKSVGQTIEMGVEEILVKLFRHWRPSPRPTLPHVGNCGANTFGGGHTVPADSDAKEKCARNSYWPIENHQLLGIILCFSVPSRINIPKKKLLIVSFLAAVVVVALFFGLYYGLRERELEIEAQRYGGVSTNGLECAKIGADILKQGGSAADAAIAALFCEGVACPQSMGLGGGFLMTIYHKDTGLVETVNARETAPALATETMFVGNPEAAITGGLAIGKCLMSSFYPLSQLLSHQPFLAS